MGKSKLEQRLTEYIEKDEDLSVLDAIYKAVKKKMKNYLSLISQNFPHYSRHDISHVEKVLANIENILGEQRIVQLSVGDVWLILLSVYLHDVGMLVSREEAKETWESQPFQEFLSNCTQGNDKDLKQAAQLVCNSGENVDALLVKHSVTLLVAEFFRRFHARRSQEIMGRQSPLTYTHIHRDSTRTPKRMGLLRQNRCAARP